MSKMTSYKKKAENYYSFKTRNKSNVEGGEGH